MSFVIALARSSGAVLGASVVALALAAPAAGQAVARPGPPGWSWSLDRPARYLAGGRAIGTDSAFEFRSMAPGWHLTMGPGAAIYDPSAVADHRFMLSADLILFPDASMNGEYGIFVGGRALESESAKEWYAFVVRGDGSAAVMHRAGPATHLVMPWTRHAGVKPRPEGATVTNVVQLHAEADSIRFLVNGERIAGFARGDLDVNGIFGFRVGSRVNLHVTNLDLTHRLAPAPPRR